MTENQGWHGDGTQETLTELVDLGAALVVDSAGLARRQSVQIASVTDLDRPMRRIAAVLRAIRFWRGDLMNLAETLFGEEAAQIVDSEHLTEAEARAEKLVAAKVKPTTRAHAQSWDHARAVLALNDDQQVEWLDKSRAESWTARKLAAEVAQAIAGPGKTSMRFWLVVECGTEARRDKLADELSVKGYTIKKQEKLSKVAKPKRKKKEPVTAKKKRSGERPRNQRPKKA